MQFVGFGDDIGRQTKLLQLSSLAGFQNFLDLFSPLIHTVYLKHGKQAKIDGTSVDSGRMGSPFPHIFLHNFQKDNVTWFRMALPTIFYPLFLEQLAAFADQHEKDPTNFVIYVNKIEHFQQFAKFVEYNSILLVSYLFWLGFKADTIEPNYKICYFPPLQLVAHESS